MSTLVLNAGSTSLKFGLFDAEGAAASVSGSIDWADGRRHQARRSLEFGTGGRRVSTVCVPDDLSAVTCALDSLPEKRIEAVGHRVVHGGTFDRSLPVDASVKAALARWSELAPLHNPPALAAMEAVEKLLPGVPQVAVFDTAFFAGLPPRAHLYGLPYEWHERWGIRRIGFHGISNAWCAGRAAVMLGRPPDELRLVTCHLGGGCSATAVQAGLPVATTMGFTPLEGLMMGTRSGSVDPGLLLHLQRRCGVTLDQLDEALNRRSGLLGISGVSSDLAEIEVAMRQGNPRARHAFEMFANQVRAAIGSLAVQMGGMDALIFTDRIGERSPALRESACQGLECLGVRLDPSKNAEAVPDTDIADSSSPARVLVLRTQEELLIARETQRVMNSGSAKPPMA